MRRLRVIITPNDGIAPFHFRTMTDRLRCHVTVAAVVERAGRYLFVEERAQGRRVLNQPAGHLEAGEDLLTAVIREMREETGLRFEPDAWLGCDLLTMPGGAITLRAAFTGSAHALPAPVVLDPAILGTHWLTVDEVGSGAWELRSPLVLRSLLRHRQGLRLPLETAGSLLSGT